MGVIIVGSSKVVSKGIKNKNTIWRVILLSIYIKEEKLKLHKDISSPTFIAALCTTDIEITMPVNRLEKAIMIYT